MGVIKLLPVNQVFFPAISLYPTWSYDCVQGKHQLMVHLYKAPEGQ